MAQQRQPVIELQKITKDFGAFRALDNVTLNIQPGITSLLGPNGAGKSTLIKVLLGLLPTTNGRGRVLDYEIGRQTRKIRACVGYLPEDDCFFHSLTGVESVQLSARLSSLPPLEGLRRSHEMLDFCGMGQDRYRAVETYSTGMRQKLRFAQAIVHDPPVLILDEPTSGLDPEERTSMLNRIRLLAHDHGKTVLLCTHILPDVQAVSDGVVILAQGQVRLADQLDVLSRPTEPSVRVRLSGDAESFERGLRRYGLNVSQGADGALIVAGQPADTTQLIWRVAHKLGVGIRSITPARTSLDEIFLAAVQEQPDGSS